jgi:hypothetical protein
MTRTSVSEGASSVMGPQGPHLAPVNPHQHVNYSHSDPGVHFYSAFQSLRPSLHPVPFGQDSPKNFSSGNYAIPNQLPVPNYFPSQGYQTNSNDYEDAAEFDPEEYESDADAMFVQMNSLSLNNNNKQQQQLPQQQQKGGHHSHHHHRPQSPKFAHPKSNNNAPPIGFHHQLSNANDYASANGAFASQFSAPNSNASFVGHGSKSSPSLLGPHGEMQHQHQQHHQQQQQSHYSSHTNGQHLSVPNYNGMPYNPMPAYASLPLREARQHSPPPHVSEDSEDYHAESPHEAGQQRDVFPETAFINSFGFGGPFDVVCALDLFFCFCLFCSVVFFIVLCCISFAFVLLAFALRCRITSRPRLRAAPRWARWYSRHPAARRTRASERGLPPTNI